MGAGPAALQGMTFTPDGKLIVPGTGDTFRFLDLSTGQLVDPKAVAALPANAAGLRKMLETPVGVDFNNQPLSEALDHFRRQIKANFQGGSSVNLLPPMGDIPVTAKLPERVSLAAALQFLEDKLGIRFVIREYGIVGMNRDEVPSGALTVSEFLRRDVDHAR